MKGSWRGACRLYVVEKEECTFGCYWERRDMVLKCLWFVEGSSGNRILNEGSSALFADEWWVA